MVVKPTSEEAQMEKASKEDLIRRALSAWFRTGGTDQPSAASGVAEHGGKQYVVLNNVAGVLAVYRVRNDGVLKRLARPPAVLMAQA